MEEETERAFPISNSMIILMIVSLASLFYLALQKYYIEDLQGMMIVMLQGLFVGLGLMLAISYKRADPDFGTYAKVKQPTAISFGLLLGLGMALAIMFLGNQFSLFSMTGGTHSIFSSVSGITFDSTFHSGMANWINFTAFFSLSGTEIATIILSTFFVAISEEAFFRFTLPSLIYRFRGEEGYWSSSIVGLIVFGMYHAFVGGIMVDLFGGMVHTIVITILGFIFIVIYYYTRSLLATFSFHFIYNFLLITGAILFGLIFLGISVLGTVIYYQYQRKW